MAETEIRCGEALPKLSAALSGVCLLFHLVLVFVAGPGMLAMTLPMLGLAGLCAGCAVGAWRRRCSDRELWLTALLAAAMVSSHLILTSAPAGLAICTSTDDGAATGSLPGLRWMSGGDGAAAAERLMPAGIALAGIAGLLAMGALAHRRLAP